MPQCSMRYIIHETAKTMRILFSIIIITFVTVFAGNFSDAGMAAGTSCSEEKQMTCLMNMEKWCCPFTADASVLVERCAALMSRPDCCASESCRRVYLSDSSAMVTVRSQEDSPVVSSTAARYRVFSEFGPTLDRRNPPLPRARSVPVFLRNCSYLI